jgi:hypothetical protein
LFSAFLFKAIGAKAAHKMLAKLTTGLYFTNVLRVQTVFLNLRLQFVLYSQIKIGRKGALKMMVKLTTAQTFSSFLVNLEAIIIKHKLNA